MVFVPNGSLEFAYFIHTKDMFTLFQVEYHSKDVEQFLDNVQSLEEYLSVKAIKAEDNIKESDARNFATYVCHYFSQQFIDISQLCK